MRSAIVRIDESRVEVELIDPVKIRPEALGWHFRYPQLEEMKARELVRLRRANSHLALGVFYTREGMAAEAEKEFQILVDNNPHSTIAQRLLRIFESWK